MNQTQWNSPAARVARSFRSVVIVVLAVAASMGTAVRALADPVLDRYGRDFTASGLKYSYDMKFTGLTHPGTDADVKADRAIFTLAGLGEGRIWKLPAVPAYGQWNNGKERTERPHGNVLQAEELLVDGTWRRYFGFVAKEGTAVVPAEEFEFWPLPDEDQHVAWWWFTGGFAIGMDTPGVTVEKGKFTATPASLAEPILVHGWIQNLRGISRGLPGDLYRKVGEAKHSLRKGIRIHLSWAPFDPRQALRAYPRDCDFTPVPSTFAQHDADEARTPGVILDTFGKKQIWEIDLRDLFAITKEGHYSFGFEFDEEALGLTGKRDSPIRIQGFDIGTRPRELTSRELNDEIGCLGGKAGIEKLRQAIADDFRTPLPDAADATPLPADFPTFKRTGFMGGNMSGNESQFIQFSLSNSELVDELRKYSRKSVCAEFQKRMIEEKENPALRLIYAGIASQAGSEAAAVEILESMKSTDYESVMNTQTLLARLLWINRESPARWIVELAMATVADDRVVTGLEKGNFSEGTTFRISYLADEDGRVVQALGEAKCRQAVPLLIERVRQSGASRGYVMALGDMGDDRAIPILMEFLVRLIGEENDNLDRRDRLIWALARLKAKDCVPLLINHLEYSSSVEALESIGDPRALVPLKALIEAEGAVTRDGKSVADYAREERLGQAKIAVAVLEPGDSVVRLCELLADTRLDKFQHIDVVCKLRDLHDPRAVPHLLTVIRNDKEGYILHFAMSALPYFRCPEAVDGLIECLAMDFNGKNAGRLAYEPEMFIEVAHQGLRDMTGQEFPASASRWKSWWAQNRGTFRFKETSR